MERFFTRLQSRRPLLVRWECYPVNFPQSIADTGSRLPRLPGAELGRYAVWSRTAHTKAALHPDRILILDNAITNPVSCGVYVAIGRNPRVHVGA